MESGVIAVGAAAIAYYAYYRTPGTLSGNAVETHRHIEQAPRSWTGEVYLFAEALRYLYLEYITHWQTADLFIGVFYLARQGISDYRVVEVVAHGRRLLPNDLDKIHALELKRRFDLMHRLLVYSQKLRNTSIEIPSEDWIDLGICSEDFVQYRPKASVLCPAYIIVKDPVIDCFVLAIRGTHTMRDIFTSLSGAAKPHHTVDRHGLVMGYSHLGMLAGARWIFKDCKKMLLDAHAKQPDYGVIVTGHSMGGGAAAMLTMMIREQLPQLGDVQCYTFACPGCMTQELARSCAPYVTTLIYGADVVPTISPGAGDALREEVAQSSWRNSFRQDIRSSTIVRSLEGGIRGVYRSASTWTLRHARTVSNLTAACIRPRNRTLPESTHVDQTRLDIPPSTEDSKSTSNFETKKESMDEDVADRSNSREDEEIDPLQKEMADLEIDGLNEINEANEHLNEMDEGVRVPLLDQGTKSENGHRPTISELWNRMSSFAWRRRVVDADPENNEGIGRYTRSVARDCHGCLASNEGESSNEDSNGCSSNLKRLLYPAGKIYHLVPDSMLQSNNPTPETPSVSSHTDPSRDPEDESAFIMFTDMPQEAYGKIRVCRSMVQDHFVPRYKTALQSVIQDLTDVIEEETTQTI